MHARPRARLAYVCPTCRHAQRRAVSTSWINKKAEAREQWQKWGEQIQAGTRPSPLSLLEARGFVHQTTGERKELDELLVAKRVGVYCGIDPTAPSLHIGHMLPLMALFWMHVNGFHTVSLVGGQTARIGDPSGRSKDRPEMTNTERKANIVGIHYQTKKLWANLENTARRHGFEWEKYWHREIANNATWWNRTPFTDVLKLLGQGLRMGELLKRDTARTKLESGDGMSFAEFCYPIMQAWDWWYMYDTKDIQIQIGGADQYGNIVAGVDAIKHIAKTHPDPVTRQENGVTPLTTPYGLTVPLLTTASGAKFGKSAGNAVWLEENMTSLFDLYAFFVKTADADVERFLKLFTFLPLEKIDRLMTQHKADTSKRLAQRILAYEFVHLVHGGNKATLAQTQYDKRAGSRTSTSLASLMEGQEKTGNESESSEPPPHHLRDPLSPPPVPENPLSNKTYLGQRVQATHVSPKLNRYAPPPDPNKPSGQTHHIVLPASLIRNVPIARVLYSAGLVASRSEGHRLAQNRGAYIGRMSNGRGDMPDHVSFIPAKLQDPTLTWANVIRDHESGAMDTPGDEGVLVLRSGKWKVRVVRIVSDEKFDTLGLPDPPGWLEHKSVMAAHTVADRLDDAPIPPPGHSASAELDDPEEPPDEPEPARGDPSPALDDHDGPSTPPDDTPAKPAGEFDDPATAFTVPYRQFAHRPDKLPRAARRPPPKHPVASEEFVEPTERFSRRWREAHRYAQEGAALKYLRDTSGAPDASRAQTLRALDREVGRASRARAGLSRAAVLKLRAAKQAAVAEQWRRGSAAVRERRARDLERRRAREGTRMTRVWRLGGARVRGQVEGMLGAGADGQEQRA